MTHTMTRAWKIWNSRIGPAMVVLLLAGCGVTSPSAGRASATHPAKPTATPALTWRQATFPNGFDPQHWGLAMSPVDGRDLWLCAPASGDGFTIWASRDAALTWRQVGSIVIPTAASSGMCTLVADQGYASTLVAVFTSGSGEAGTLRSASMVSIDGGAHWHVLPGDIKVQEVGTSAGTMYALLMNMADPADSSSGLVVSTDGLYTWRPINPAGLPTHDNIFQFWLGAAASDLAAASSQDTLWYSDDSGTNWSHLPTPAIQMSMGAWLPKAGHWLFCGGGQGTITCSADQGKSWQPQPSFNFTLQCGTCGKGGAPYTDTQACIPDIIAGDGSLLADCPTTGSTPDWAGATAFTLYQLALNTPAWTTLGAAPAKWLTLSASGQLWCWDPQGGKLFVTQISL